MYITIHTTNFKVLVFLTVLKLRKNFIFSGGQFGGRQPSCSRPSSWAVSYSELAMNIEVLMKGKEYCISENEVVDKLNYSS